MSKDLFSQIPIKRDFDPLIKEVKQLLQHAICIDHKKNLSDDTCRIFEIRTPQQAIAIFATDSIPYELLFPKIISLAENNDYTEEEQLADKIDMENDQLAAYKIEMENEKYERDRLDAAQLKADIQYEINEHRRNDGPDSTFDSTYKFGSDDAPSEDDEQEGFDDEDVDEEHYDDVGVEEEKEDD